MSQAPAPAAEHEQLSAERVLDMRSWTAAASPSKPFRMSVRPTASHTRVPVGKPIIAIARSPAAASRAIPRREGIPVCRTRM